MAYRNSEQQAEADDLVAGLLLPSGITEYELARVLRTRLGVGDGGNGGPKGLGHTSLRRLEAAGRARCVEEPAGGKYGFRRVWYPVVVQERGRT